MEKTVKIGSGIFTLQELFKACGHQPPFVMQISQDVADREGWRDGQIIGETKIKVIK